MLDYVKTATGHDRVNWVGHSLGGMLMIAHLEQTDRPDRIANFVDMGGVAVVPPPSPSARCSTRIGACGRLLRS